MDPKPNANPGEQGDTGEVSFTTEQLNALNSIITSQVKRHFKDVATVAATKAMFDELKATLASGAPEPAESDRDGKGRFAGKSVEAHPEVAKAVKRIQDLEEKLRQEQEARTQAERRRIEDKARSDLRSYFTGALDPKLRVKDDLVEYVIAKVVDRDKALKVNDDGTVSMTVMRSAAKGLEPEPHEMPLHLAVAEWFKTKEASAVVSAAPLSGGSGKTTTARPAPSQQGPRIADANVPPRSRDEAIADTFRDFAEQGISADDLLRVL